MAKSIESIVQKQIDNLSRSGDRIKEGIMGVTVAPGKLAAQNKERYLAGINKSVDKWADNVASVSLTDWQQAAVEKGVPRIAEGIRQAAPKLTDFHTQLQNFQTTYLSKLNAKPVLSLTDAISKMSENVTQMSKFRYKRK